MSKERLPDLSRRAYLAGAATVGALGAGGVLYNGDLPFTESEMPTFVAQQGYLRWELEPMSYRDQTVKEFYGYDDGGAASANPSAALAEEDAASRVFAYTGPVNDSLGFLHGGPNGPAGEADFSFSGLNRSKGEWVVQDDPSSADDDYEPWEGGNQRVDWQWPAGGTDGGAFWNAFESTVTVTAKTLSGVDSWRLLSGSDPADATVHELSPEKPLKVREAKRPVKTINVDVMPDAEDNVFDPYSQDTLDVAVKPGGEVEPDDLDPGNYSLYFGSREYLAGQNGASPQKSMTIEGDLLLKYKISAANFSLSDRTAYLVGKSKSGAWVRGTDTIHPGGFGTGEPTGDLVVSDLHVDAAGADEENLNGEWVEFQNAGDAALDLTGYTVRDEEGWAFNMPDGFALDPQETVRLHTGSGEYGPHNLYWGVESEVWQNGGGTVLVEDDTGTTVVEYEYPRN
ncbi:lamin tail domain-containing protein [Salarchaeum sp. III]|uniref:lamin tail domain-containing protein n=1 Tax=Salarchaeum sp. III TaxID=3107927 RepID=UPI002ED91F04